MQPTFFLAVLIGIVGLGCGDPPPKAPRFNNENNQNNLNNQNNQNNGGSISIVAQNIGNTTIHTYGGFGLMQDGNTINTLNPCAGAPDVEPTLIPLLPGELITFQWDGMTFDGDCNRVPVEGTGPVTASFCSGLESIDGQPSEWECQETTFELGDTLAEILIDRTVSDRGTIEIILTNDGEPVAIQASENCTSPSWATLHTPGGGPLQQGSWCGTCACNTLRMGETCEPPVCAAEACEQPRAEFLEALGSSSMFISRVYNQPHSFGEQTCLQNELLPKEMEIEVCVGQDVEDRGDGSYILDVSCGRFPISRDDDVYEIFVSDVTGLD